MSNIVESATLDDIALYLQREDGISPQQAKHAALEVIAGFKDMQAKGLIKGWYFNELGQLELLPSDSALNWIANQK